MRNKNLQLVLRVLLLFQLIKRKKLTWKCFSACSSKLKCYASKNLHVWAFKRFDWNIRNLLVRKKPKTKQLKSSDNMYDILENLATLSDISFFFFFSYSSARHRYDQTKLKVRFWIFLAVPVRTRESNFIKENELTINSYLVSTCLFLYYTILVF